MTPSSGPDDDRTRAFTSDPRTAPLDGRAPLSMEPDGPPPERIGLYEIERELGRGGMGVIYIARDPRLERQVALKTLPAQFAQDADAFGRFRQEARLLASVNHPNIAIIHSLEEVDGTHFLTMELIDGHTLADSVAEGPLPTDELLAVGRQVATALEAAHKQGVVHRDLKPRNIMITTDGLVKVLDFGLAVAVAPGADRGAGGGEAVGGTPGYMSPEQINGEPPDTRTDIWAYGCCLYECCSGKQAFGGETLVEVLRATLEGKANLDELPDDIPLPIYNLIDQCLTRDLDSRLDSITRARQQIEEEVARRAMPVAVRRKRPEREAVPNNLPLQLASFVGRQTEYAEIEDLLEENRLVTLVGFGGVGKTRLSIEVGRNALTTATDGVWLVELAPLVDPDLIPQAVATPLGLTDQPGRSILDGLIDHLKERRVLLILDNCEHLIRSTAQLVHRLLQACPELRILASSREALGVPGEVLYQVPALRVPAAGATPSLEELERSDAIQLFVERATVANPQFVLSADNADTVVSICRRLDGIPLALELAAVRTKVLAPHEIDERLDDRFRLLTGGSKVGLPHHRTLRALIDWSYDQLTDQERAVLRRLSLFAGGFTLDAAEATCVGDDVEAWEILDMVAQLVDKSLVELDAEGAQRTGKARYRMLQTVRAYASQKLEESGEADTVAARHRDLFIALAEEAEPQLLGADQATWLLRLGTEHDNLRRAMDTCLADETDESHGLRLAGALGRYWYVRGHWNEARRALTMTLARTDSSIETAHRAMALNWAGNMAKLQGDTEEAARLLEECIRVRKVVGDEPGVAASLGNLGVVAQDRGEYEQARTLYEESLSIQQRLDNLPGIALALQNLGVVTHYQGDHEAALSFYEQALALKRELGDRGGVAALLNNLGLVAETQADYEQALAWLDESVEIRRELGDRWGIAAGLGNLGRVAERSGDAERALTLHDESLTMFRELGDRRGIAMTLINLGTAKEDSGEHEAAQRFFGESLEIAQELDDTYLTVDGLRALGSLACDRQAFLRSVRMLAAAEAARERMQVPLPPDQQAALDRRRAELRSAMGEADFEHEWAIGSELTLEDAVTYALSDR